MVQGGTSIVLGSITSLHDRGGFQLVPQCGRRSSLAGIGITEYRRRAAGHHPVLRPHRHGDDREHGRGNDLFAFNGSLLGFTGANSSIGCLHVLGSVTGGATNDSAEIYANGTIGKIVIDGNLRRQFECQFQQPGGGLRLHPGRAYPIPENRRRMSPPLPMPAPAASRIAARSAPAGISTPWRSTAP